MTKRFRGEEAASRLGLPLSILEGFVAEGLIVPSDTIGGSHYFLQPALDRLIHDLHSRIQRASWRDMEDRMEDVEKRISELEQEMSSKKQGPHLI